MEREYQAGTVSPQAFCEFYVATLAGRTRAHWEPLRREFLDTVVAPRIGRGSHELVERHRGAGELVVLTTATNRFLTELTAAHLGLPHLIATECELDADGRFTGRIAGTLNMREGKVSRLHEWLAAQRLDAARLRVHVLQRLDQRPAAAVGRAPPGGGEPRHAPGRGGRRARLAGAATARPRQLGPARPRGSALATGRALPGFTLQNHRCNRVARCCRHATWLPPRYPCRRAGRCWPCCRPAPAWCRNAPASRPRSACRRPGRRAAMASTGSTSRARLVESLQRSAADRAGRGLAADQHRRAQPHSPTCSRRARWSRCKTPPCCRRSTPAARPSAARATAYAAQQPVSRRLRRELGARSLRRQPRRLERRASRCAGQRRLAGRRAGLGRRRGGDATTSRCAAPACACRWRARTSSCRKRRCRSRSGARKPAWARRSRSSRRAPRAEQTRALIPVLDSHAWRRPRSASRC